MNKLFDKMTDVIMGHIVFVTVVITLVVMWCVQQIGLHMETGVLRPAFAWAGAIFMVYALLHHISWANDRLEEVADDVTDQLKRERDFATRQAIEIKNLTRRLDNAKLDMAGMVSELQDYRSSYITEPETIEKLQAVKRRLYGQKALNWNQQRDLANTLDVLLDEIIRPENQDVPVDWDNLGVSSDVAPAIKAVVDKINNS